MSYPFPDDQLYLVFDYETRSEANLKHVGAWEYSMHPSTRILCVSYRLGTRAELREIPIKNWSPFLQKRIPLDFAVAIKSKKVIKVAHNTGFEMAITANVLPRYM